MLECRGLSFILSMRAVLVAPLIASMLCLGTLPARASSAAAATTTTTPAAVEPDAASAPPATGRLSDLEQRLDRQQRESRAAQQAIAALQGQLHEAEEARLTEPATYGLMALVMLLLGAIAWLLLRMTRQPREAAWSEASSVPADEDDDEESGPADGFGNLRSPFEQSTAMSMHAMSETRPAVFEDTRRPARDLPPTTIPMAASLPRALPVDDLVDIEQQADFFVALGQEEAAIDLLMGHARSGGGRNPTPYLKLLDIYRRRGEGDAYERIRERFNRRFNSRAPSREDDPRAGRALQEYSGVLAHVVASWSPPSRAVALLEALLVRRDASPEPFELPAFEELLFLCTVAHDLAEHETNPEGVDLPLPLGPDESAITMVEVTRPFVPGSLEIELDLDLSDPSPKAP
jgi:hypothetical protein